MEDSEKVSLNKTYLYLLLLLFKTNCNICFSNGEREKISQDIGYRIITCSKCKLSCHLRCYGEKSINTNQDKSENYNFCNFTCQKCISNVNKENITCIVCYNSKGILRQIESSNNWIHIVCAMFTDCFEIIDYSRMIIVASIPNEILLKNIYILNNNNIKSYNVDNNICCIYCNNNKGLILSCEQSDCNCSAHLYCALEDKSYQLSQDCDSSNFWQINWKFCNTVETNFINNNNNKLLNNTTNFPLLNLETSEYKYLLNKPYYEEKIINDLIKYDLFSNNNLTKFVNTDNNIQNIHLIKNNQETNTNKKKNTDKVKAKSKNKTNQEQIADSKDNNIYDIINYNNYFSIVLKSQNIDKTTSKKHTNKTEKNNNLNKLYEKNWFIKNRGGVFDIFCVQHREQLKYCKCQKTFDKPEFMICCDNCEIWYHGRCVGIEENKPIVTWICQYCSNWIKQRKNYIIKELSDNNNIDSLTEQCLKTDWKHFIVHEHINYRIIDLILIGSIFQKKTDVLISSTSTIKIVSNHILNCLSIPLKLQWNYLLLMYKKNLFEIEIKNNILDKNKLDNLTAFNFNLELKEFKNNISISIIDTLQSFKELNTSNSIEHNLFNKNTISKAILYFKNTSLKGFIDNSITENISITFNEDDFKTFNNNYNVINEKTNNLLVNSKIYLEEIEELKSVLNIAYWGIKSYCLLSDSNKPTLSDLKTHISNYYIQEKEINEMLDNNDKLYFYKEYITIKNYIEETLKWQKSTKELLSHHMKLKKGKSENSHSNEEDIDILLSYQEIQNSKKKFVVDKDNFNNNIYLEFKKKADPLIKKDQEYRKSYLKRKQFFKNFDFKMKLSDISKVVNTGKELKVNLNKEIVTMEECIKEFYEWEDQLNKLKQNCLYYINKEKEVNDDSDKTIDNITLSKKEEFEEILYNTKNIVISNYNMYDIANLIFLTELNEIKFKCLKTLVTKALLENEKLNLKNEFSDIVENTKSVFSNILSSDNPYIYISNTNLSTLVNCYYNNYSDILNIQKNIIKLPIIVSNTQYDEISKEYNQLIIVIDLVKSKLSKIVKEEVSISNLQIYFKEFDNIKFLEEETKLIKKKISIISNIDKQLNNNNEKGNNKLTKDNIIELELQIKQNNLEELFGELTENKLNLINKANKFIDDYINGIIMNPKEIISSAKNISYELEKQRIITDEVVSLEKILRIYSWYKTALDAIELKKNDSNNQVKFITIKSAKVVDNQSSNISGLNINNERFDKKEHEIDDMLHLHIDFVKKLLNDINVIINKDKYKQLLQGNALSLYEKLSILSWYKKAKRIKLIIESNYNEKLDIDELHDLSKTNLENIKNEKTQTIMREIQSILLQYNMFSKDYEEIEDLFINNSIEDITYSKDKLEKLFNNYEKLINTVNLKDKLTKLESFKFIIEYLLQFDLILKKEKIISFKELDYIINTFESKFITEKTNINNSNILENNTNTYQILTNTNNSDNKVNYININNYQAYNLIKKELHNCLEWEKKYNNYLNYKSKKKLNSFNYEELININETTKDLIIDLEEEKKILSDDIIIINSWYASFEDLICNKINIKLEYSTILEEKENIYPYIDNIKKLNIDVDRITNINNKDYFSILNLLNWIAKAYDLLIDNSIRNKEDSNLDLNLIENSDLAKNNNINNSKKLDYKSAVKLLSDTNSLRKEIKNFKIYKLLYKSIVKAKAIKETIDLLKKEQKILSEKEFIDLQSSVNVCLINLKEEYDFVSLLKEKKEYLTNKAESLYTIKQQLNDFEILLIEMKKFPIILNMTPIVENSIISTKEQQKKLRLVLDSKNKRYLSYDDVNKYLVEYKNSKIIHSEGENMIKIVDKSNDTIKELEDILSSDKKILSSPISETTLSFYQDKLDSIDIHHPLKETNFKISLWLNKCFIYIINKFINKSPINYRIAKGLIIEADEIGVTKFFSIKNDELENCNEYKSILSSIISIDFVEYIEFSYLKRNDISKQNLHNYSIENIIDNVLLKNNYFKLTFNIIEGIVSIGDKLIQDVLNCFTLLDLNNVLSLSKKENLDIDDYIDEQILKINYGLVKNKLINESGLKKSSTDYIKDITLSKKRKINNTFSNKIEDKEEYYLEKPELINDAKELPSNSNNELLSNVNTRPKRIINMKKDNNFIYDDPYYNKLVEQANTNKADNTKLSNNDSSSKDKDNKDNSEYLPEEDIIKCPDDLISPLELDLKEKINNINYEDNTTSNIKNKDSKNNIQDNIIKKNTLNNNALLLKTNISNKIKNNNSSLDVIKKKDTSNLLPIPTNREELRNTLKHLILNVNEFKNKASTEFIKKNIDELQNIIKTDVNNILDAKNIQLYNNIVNNLKDLSNFKCICEQIIKGKLNLSKIISKGIDIIKKLEEKILKQKEDFKNNKINTKIINKSNTNNSTTNILKTKSDNIFSYLDDIKSIYNFVGNNSKINSETLTKTNENNVLNSNEKKELNNIISDIDDDGVFQQAKFSPTNNTNDNSNYFCKNNSISLNSNINSEDSLNVLNYNPLGILKSLNLLNTTSIISNNIDTETNINPLLYNPKYSYSIVKNNFTKEKNTLSNNKTTNSCSLLLPWNGVIVSQTTSLFVQMISKSNFNIWNYISRIDSKMVILNKAKNKEVIPYIEKFLNNKSKHVLQGWLEVPNSSNIDNYIKLYNELNDNDRSGYIKLSNENKLYIVPLNLEDNNNKSSNFFKKYNNIEFYNKDIMNKLSNRLGDISPINNVEDASKSFINNILLIYIIINNCTNENNLYPEILKEFKIDNNICEDKEDDKLSVLTDEGDIDNITVKTKNSNDLNKVSNKNTLTTIDNNSYEYYNSINKTQEDKGEKSLSLFENNANKNINKQIMLKQIITNNDTKMLEDYINRFKSLSEEEAYEELNCLDNDTKEKLLELIQNYEENCNKLIEKDVNIENTNKSNVNTALNESLSYNNNNLNENISQNNRNINNSNFLDNNSSNLQNNPQYYQYINQNRLVNNNNYMQNPNNMFQNMKIPLPPNFNTFTPQQKQIYMFNMQRRKFI